VSGAAACTRAGEGALGGWQVGRWAAVRARSRGTAAPGAPDSHPPPVPPQLPAALVNRRGRLPLLDAAGVADFLARPVGLESALGRGGGNGLHGLPPGTLGVEAPRACGLLGSAAEPDGLLGVVKGASLAAMGTGRAKPERASAKRATFQPDGDAPPGAP
jgi:hypothetical protein